MKKLLLFVLSFVVLSIFFSSCTKEVITTAEGEPLKLFYKIEHVEEQYPFPVNPLGPVVISSGYKYEIETGGTIYIKDSTELDFWLSDHQMKTTWVLEQVGHGGSIISNTATLKTSFLLPGEFLLKIETPNTIQIKICRNPLSGPCKR